MRLFPLQPFDGSSQSHAWNRFAVRSGRHFAGLASPPDRHRFSQGIGEVWKHQSLRVAYVAQHSMHHLEENLQRTPLAYIQVGATSPPPLVAGGLTGLCAAGPFLPGPRPGACQASDTEAHARGAGAKEASGYGTLRQKSRSLGWQCWRDAGLFK